MPAVMCYPGLWNISHPLIRNYSNYELSACQKPLLKREVKQPMVAHQSQPAAEACTRCQQFSLISAYSAGAQPVTSPSTPNLQDSNLPKLNLFAHLLLCSPSPAKHALHSLATRGRRAGTYHQSNQQLLLLGAGRGGLRNTAL